MTEPSALHLRIQGATIAVPPSLSAITTYVLLEQEEWFEKEIRFLRRFLKPGMTAIDIGANLGVYSLPMARLVGPGGRVFAYEPGKEARTLLVQSRALNNFDNLEIVDAALSDGERLGTLAVAESSELRALSSNGQGEPVRITSLDLEAAARGWSSIDFVKIDAEGEEERIIDGARDFFAAHSPLVMFEIKAGRTVNERLRVSFPAIGYRLFRQVGGAEILVPQALSEPLDDYELNLFAAKPDRVAALSQKGLLVEEIPSWTPTDKNRQDGIDYWRRQKFATPTPLFDPSRSAADAAYRDGLTAYATWRAKAVPPSIRCAALSFAYRSLRTLCTGDCNVERLSTWARIAFEWGARRDSVVALQRLIQRLERSSAALSEPFWPPNPRFDSITARDRPAQWLAAAAAEQLERTAAFSSFYRPNSPALAWLCSQSFASTEMVRRLTLIAARAGLRPTVPIRLCSPAPDHLNAPLWRSGKVPGTGTAT